MKRHLFNNPADSQKGDADEYLKNVGGMFVFDVASGIYKPKTYDKQRNSKFWEKKFPKWASIAVGALTLFFVIKYTNYARLQWHEMIRAADASQEAADAAANTAVIADQTLKASRAQFRNQQRPYIWAFVNAASPKNQLVEIQPNGGHQIDWTIGIKNAGQSPAIEVFTTPSTTKIVATSRFESEVKSFTPNWGTVPVFISPNSDPTTVPTGPWISLDPTQEGEIAKGKTVVYVIGAIKYRDIFDPPQTSYETRYCFKFNPVGLAVGNCPLGNTIK